MCRQHVDISKMPPKRKASTDLDKENHYDSDVEFEIEVEDEYDSESDDKWSEEFNRRSSSPVVFRSYSSDDQSVDSWHSEKSQVASVYMKRELDANLAAKKASMSSEEFDK